MSRNTSPDNVPSAKKGTADSLAAPGRVGAGGTLNQSIRKSSSRALSADDLSGMSVQRNPGGAGGAWGDGAAGSLNRASEIPSLTPALIAEYSTQYVSSIPMAAAMNGNSSPSPINPMVASPSFEAADLKSAPGRVGAGGTKQPALESGWSEFKEVAGVMLRSPIFWSLIPLNAAIVVLANWQYVMTWWSKDTPFAVVEDWPEFLAFVVVYSLGNLVEGLTNFFRAVFA